MTASDIPNKASNLSSNNSPKALIFFNIDNLDHSNIKPVIIQLVKPKKKKKETEEEKKQLEHEQAKEELHQAELGMGYEQDEKFNESED